MIDTFFLLRQISRPLRYKSVSFSDNPPAITIVARCVVRTMTSSAREVDSQTNASLSDKSTGSERGMNRSTSFNSATVVAFFIYAIFCFHYSACTWIQALYAFDFILRLGMNVLIDA